jgi:hypothetical protein
MVMRVREAVRLFFEVRTKKFQATGWKVIPIAEIYATGFLGRRSLTPTTTLLHSGWMVVVQTKMAQNRDGAGPGIRA